MPRINWGQAAGEAVLILLGILLALAVDTWWEERAERRTEREYLQALATELREMTTYVEGVERRAVEIQEAGRELLTVSSNWDSEAVSSDSLAALLVSLSLEGEWSPPTTVYEDLVNTGTVEIIRSEAVRRGLNELMASVDWVEGRQVRHNEFFWGEMDPYFRQQLPILAVFAYEGLGTSESWTPGAFVRTEEFRNLVAVKSMTAVDVRDGAAELIGLIERLAAIVTAEAGAL